jgi:hypothetical protein
MKTITVKTSTGKYKVYRKEFKSDRHRANWEKFLMSRGIKIIAEI